MAGDYQTTGVRFETMHVPEIRDPVLVGPGHGPIEGAVDTYRQLAERLQAAGDAVRSALVAAQAAHEGPAAEASARHLAALVRPGDAGAEQARMAAVALEDQATYHVRARNELASVRPEDIPPNYGIAPPFYVFGELERSRQQAVAAATVYQENTNHNLATGFQLFQPPAPVTVDLAAAPAPAAGPAVGGDVGAVRIGPGGEYVPAPVSPAAVPALAPAPVAPLPGTATAPPAGGAPPQAVPVIPSGPVSQSPAASGPGRSGPGSTGPVPQGPVAGGPGRPGSPDPFPGVPAPAGSRPSVVDGPADRPSATSPAVPPVAGTVPQAVPRLPPVGDVPDRPRLDDGILRGAPPPDVRDGVIAGRPPWPGTRPSETPGRVPPIASDVTSPRGAVPRSAVPPGFVPPVASEGSNPRAVAEPGPARPGAPGEPTRPGAAPRSPVAPGYGHMPFLGAPGGTARDEEHRRPSWLVEDDPEALWFGDLPPHVEPVITPDQHPDDRM